MKEKVSFKMFLADKWRGICQAFRWIAGWLGFNDPSSFGKIVRRVFAGSAAAVAIVFAIVVAYEGYSAIVEDIEERKERNRDYDLVETRLSSRLSYMHMPNRYTKKHSYLYDRVTGKKMLRDKVAWVICSDDGDSLAVFSDGDKRGYLNRFTGDVVIPAIYNRAWVFSDGVACVQVGEAFMFIDHDGEPISGERFYFYIQDPIFRKGYCAVADKSFKWGIINKKGEWQLGGCSYKDIYSVFIDGRYYWVLTAKDGKQGVRTEKLAVVLDMNYTDIDFDETGIFATDNEGWRKKFSFDGKVIEEFVVQKVFNLGYATDKRDADGNAFYKPTPCKVYYTDSQHCGLMSADGRPLTRAVYESIHAVSADRFLCNIKGAESVMLDNHGRKVKPTN